MSYKFSNDYKLLFDLINKGHEVIAFGSNEDFVEGYIFSFKSPYAKLVSICRKLIPKKTNIPTSVEMELICFHGIDDKDIHVTCVNAWDGKTKEENVYMFFEEKCKKHKIQFLPI